MDSKKLIADIKKQGKADRKMVSFRLPPELYKEFQRICDREGLFATEILEKLISDFTAGYSKKER